MASFSSFRIGTLLCLLLLLQCQWLIAQTSAPEAPVEFIYRDAIQSLNPMDLDGLDPQVARILSMYYQNSLGGWRGWEQIESFRFEGVLRLPEGTLSFVAFKKKPDYCKIILSGGNGAQVVMAYDGADAWQLNRAESAEPSAMPPLEALNFIRDAPTAGHLLYPTLTGKQVELMGSRMIGEQACYDLRVTLPNGQQVTYAIDRSSYIERQQITVNAGSGATEVTTHTREQEVAGVSIPMESTMTIDGAFVHAVQMRHVEANLGLVPWFFARPAGIYVPGNVPEGSMQPAEAGTPAPHIAPGASLDLFDPARSSFGLEPEAVDLFEPTHFPDLQAAPMQSILDDIGVL